MPVDSTMLARLTAEIADCAVGATVRRVVQPRHDLVALEMGLPGPWRCLVIDWSAELSRACLGREMPAPSVKEHRLGAVLRRHLRGARLTAVTQVSYDRVMHLRFANCEQLGPQSQRTLIAELMGRHSNLVLVDEANVIIEAGKRITDRVNRYRQTMPGLEYVPPPDFGRISPVEADAEVLCDRAREQGEDELGIWLRANFHGGSDLFLDEVCARAELEQHSRLSSLPAGWQQPLAMALREIPEQAAARSASYLYYDEHGERPQLAYPIELVCLQGRRRDDVPTLSAALAQLEGDLAAEHSMRELRNRLMSAVRDAIPRAQRVVTHRKEAASRADGAELDRRRGEAILAHLYELSAGQSEVTLPMFDDEGGELTIPLDPLLSPLENAQRYFRRYRKGARLNQLAPRLLAAARHNLEYLRQVETQIELAETEDDLREIEEELLAEGYAASAGPSPRATAQPTSARVGRPQPRRAQTADGYAILYGKSGAENDAVLHAAQPDDWWFHVRGAPGAHVLLRANSRPEQVPEASLEEAARLAAELSARRSEGKIVVDYTLAKHVTKPRGGRPGLAYYTGARTLLVTPSRA